MPTKAQLQEAARLACYSAYGAYMATLRGDVPAGSHKNFEPVVGQPVVEISSISMWDDPERYAVKPEYAHLRDVLNCIGTLERIAWEPCYTPEEWEELKTEGEEVPKEKAWYIRTLDGREFRWENATFIRVPNTRNFRVMNDAV